MYWVIVGSKVMIMLLLTIIQPYLDYLDLLGFGLILLVRSIKGQIIENINHS